MSVSVRSYKGEANRWRIVYDVGKVNGKRRRESEIFEGRKVDAWKRARHLMGEIDAGRYVPGTVQTFRQYVDQWLSGRSLSPTTRRGYDTLLRCHLMPALGDLNIQKIEPPGISVVLAKLADAGHVTQAQRAYRLLSTIYRSAIRAGVVGHNPVTRIDSPKPERREMTALMPDQVNRILTELARRNSWATAPFTLAFTTGLRRAEITGLRWGDFDPDAALIHVRRSVHFVRGGQMIARQPKTRLSRRAVALDARSVAMLLEYRRKCDREADLLGATITPDCPMFAPPTEFGRGEAGRPWRTDTYSRLWHRVTERLGIRARFHDTRHTSASLMLGAGIPTRLVQERLGHSSPAFTLAQYGHVMAGQQHEAAEQLARLLNGSNGKTPALPAAAAS